MICFLCKLLPYLTNILSLLNVNMEFRKRHMFLTGYAFLFTNVFLFFSAQILRISCAWVLLSFVLFELRSPLVSVRLRLCMPACLCTWVIACLVSLVCCFFVSLRSCSLLFMDRWIMCVGVCILYRDFAFFFCESVDILYACATGEIVCES